MLRSSRCFLGNGMSQRPVDVLSCIGGPQLYPRTTEEECMIEDDESDRIYERRRDTAGDDYVL